MTSVSPPEEGCSETSRWSFTASDTHLVEYSLPWGLYGAEDRFKAMVQCQQLLRCGKYVMSCIPHDVYSYKFDYRAKLLSESLRCMGELQRDQIRA